MRLFKRPFVVTALLAFVVGLLAFEPVTRELVANDDLCSYCHVATEYRPEAHLSYSRFHPTQQTEDYLEKQARCADCHLRGGFFGAVAAYSHFVSLTDLFGHFRHRMAERSGEWLPPRQVAAYRVRDRLYEYDSATCRGCHVEEEIQPKRERGKNAHKEALAESKTCIECHYNEKHRAVDVRESAFVEPAADDS